MTAWPPPSPPPDPETLELRRLRCRRLAAGSALGLSIATAASWLRVLLAGSLRIETASWQFVTCSLVLGVGLALAAVCGWRLARDAPGLPRAAILRWAIPGHLALLLAVPITSSDFFQYLAYGQLQLGGQNPLAVGPTALGDSPLLGLVSARWAAQPSVYGPLLLLLFRGAAWAGSHLGGPVWGNGAVLKAAMVGSALATLWVAARFLALHRPGPDGDRSLALIAFSPLLAWEISGQGHTDGLLALWLMLFVLAASSGRELWAVLALAAGTWMKVTIAPILALYLLFLLRTRGLRAVGYGLSALLLGAVLFLPYLDGFPGLGPLLSAVQGTHSHSLGDLVAQLVTPLGPAAQALVIRVSFLVCMAACAVVFGLTALRARTLDQLLRGCLLFFLAWDLTVPLFQPWYTTWLLPLAIADRDPRWQRLIALFCTLSVLQWAAPLDPVTSVAIDGWVVWEAARLLRSPATVDSLSDPVDLLRTEDQITG